MADPFRQGMGANFGPLGYGGGAAVGAGNLPASSYSGPQNVGEIAYQAGVGSTQANPWGGDAGIRPYNTGIMGSAAPAWQMPQYGNTMGGGAANPYTASSAGPGMFGNTMSPGSWNQIAANTRAGQGGATAADLPSVYASNILSPGGGYSGGAGASGGWDYPGINPDAGVSQYGAGLSSPAMPNSYYGGANVLSRTAPNPGPGSSPWDPNNEAYNMLYRNQIHPDLGRSNALRVANTVNQSGLLHNQQAGQALAGASNYESQGSNPFSIQTGGTGSGLFQYTDPVRTAYANKAMAGDISPESQTRTALGEITGGQYPGVYNALNNPGSTMRQMTGAIVNQFEQPALQYRPREINAATNYGMTLNSQPNALGRHQ